MPKKNESNQPKLVQVIVLINTYTYYTNTTISKSSLILDPMFLACKACSDDSVYTFFGRLFDITCKISD